MIHWHGPGWYAKDRQGNERPVPGTGRMGKNRYYDASQEARRKGMSNVRWIDIQPMEVVDEG